MNYDETAKLLKALDSPSGIQNLVLWLMARPRGFAALMQAAAQVDAEQGFQRKPITALAALEAAQSGDGYKEQIEALKAGIKRQKKHNELLQARVRDHLRRRREAEGVTKRWRSRLAAADDLAKAVEHAVKPRPADLRTHYSDLLFRVANEVNAAVAVYRRSASPAEGEEPKLAPEKLGSGEAPARPEPREHDWDNAARTLSQVCRRCLISREAMAALAPCPGPGPAPAKEGM